MAEASGKPTPLIAQPFVRRMLLVALLAEIGYAVLNISTMPVYLRNDRGFGAFGVSLVVVAFLLSEAVMKGPMGHLADRIGARRLMLIGPLITLVTSLLSLVLPRFDPAVGEPMEIALFAILRLGDGVGAAMLWPAAFALMGDVVQDRERQQAMSLLNMCYLIGIALALPIGGIVEDLTHTALTPISGGFSGGLYLSATLFLIVGIAVFRLRVPDNVAHREVPAEEGFHFREFWNTARQIPAYLLLSAITFCGIGFPMTNVKLFALEEFKLSGAQFGALVFPCAIAMAVFSVPMAKFGERIGRARAVHFGLGLCSVGLIVICLGGFFPAFRSTWVLVLGGLPVGMGFLLTIPAWLASVSDLDPNKRAANVGAVMTAQGLGAIVGAPLGGLSYQGLVPVGERLGLGASFGHYSPFMGTAICVTLGFLISLRILRDP
jgi:DHA1 family multidrug resistance protein-like MFS transporter